MTELDNIVLYELDEDEEVAIRKCPYHMAFLMMEIVVASMEIKQPVTGIPDAFAMVNNDHFLAVWVGTLWVEHLRMQRNRKTFLLKVGDKLLFTFDNTTIIGGKRYKLHNL